MLAPCRRQSLEAPPSHANSPPRILPGGRPCWRLAAGKGLKHRRATPIGRLEFRSAAAHVGALPPAKAGPRQQSAPNSARRPSMLAPCRRQSLNPPPSHANRPPLKSQAAGGLSILEPPAPAHRNLRFTFPSHPLLSFYFTSITDFTKSPYTYTCNQKTDKKTIEKGKKAKERER